MKRLASSFYLVFLLFPASSFAAKTEPPEPPLSPYFRPGDQLVSNFQNVNKYPYKQQASEVTNMPPTNDQSWAPICSAVASATLIQWLYCKLDGISPCKPTPER